MNSAQKSRILIVDDHPTNIKVLSDLLIEYGFEVLIAKDGKNALQKLQRVIPDLILLDVLMPGLDGFETCRLLKASPSTEDIPVIFMTALSDPVDKIKGLTLGAVDYVTKPLQHDEVIARVNVHLKLRSLTRQLETQNALLQEEVRSRKLAETALRFSEEKFSKAFRSNPGPMIITTLAGRRFLEVNQCFCQLTHYEPSEIQGKTVEELHLWVDPAVGDRFFHTLETVGLVSRQELEIRTKTGEVRILLVSAEVIQIAEMQCVLAMTYDITVCKQAAAELLEKEQFLSSIYEGVGASIFVLDVLEDGSYRHAGINPTHEQISGFKSEDLMGRPYQDSFPAEMVENWYRNYQLCIEANTTIVYEEYVPFQGQDHWWLTTLSPLHDQHNRIYRLVGTSIEITDRKRMEAALRQSQAKLTAAQRVAHIGNWEVDLATDMTLWSEEVFHLFGRDPNLPEPSCIEQIEQYHPDDRDRMREVIERAIQDGEPFDVDIRICHLDGSMRYANLKGEAIKNEAAAVVRLFGTAMDITEQKLAEIGLRQSEAQYRAIVEDQTELIVRFQADGVITFVNEAYCTYFQQSRDHLIGSQFHPTVLAEDQQQITQMLAALTNEQPVGTIEHCLLIGHEVRWMQWINRRIVDEQGHFVEFQSVGRDISDRKRMEAELQAAKEVADSANQAKSAFLASMSHEFRTPLHAILGFTELLALEENLSEFQQESLELINTSGEHLLGLINDVLEVSKIEAGKAVIHPVVCNLQSLFKNLEEVFQLRAQAKGLQLTVQTAPNLPHHVYLDEGKLRQILFNLLGNAIKFTESGSVVLRVEMLPYSSSETEERTNLGFCASHQLLFEVIDTGPGMPSEELNQIFAAFTQTKSGQRVQQGTGLGLYISQQLVQLLGGNITVNSTVGQGTCFQFRVAVGLPSESGDALDRSIQVPQQRIIGLEPNQPTYRILVAEDSAENRQFIVKLLSVFGFEVKEAENGQEAIALWRDWDPHLILMDMRMPVLDGYEATRQIKATARGWKTVIIAVTASALKEEQAEILTVGCDDLLYKPFKEQMLLWKLAEFLGIRYRYAPPRFDPGLSLD